MTHAIPTDPPELTRLIDEFKRLDAGLIEARKSGLFLAAQGWERDIPEFAHLVNALKIETMSFDAMPMRDRDFSLFKKTENWKTLFISGTPITGSGLDLLPESPNVVDIKISECPLRGSRLTGLRRFPNVKKVDIGRCQDADQALEYLAGLKELEYVRIDPEPAFQGDGFVHFRGHQRIERIDLNDTRVRQGMEHLADCSNLRELGLLKTELNDDQLQHAGRIKSLKRIFISSSNISDAAFASFSEHPNLESIGAFGVGSGEHRQLTEECLTYWESIPNLRRIICAFRVTQRGVDSLKRMKRLTSLWLNWPVLTKAELEMVTSQLPNCRVTADVFE